MTEKGFKQEQLRRSDYGQDSISRRQLLAVLGGTGSALAAQAMLQSPAWGISVTGAAYGEGGGSSPCCCVYSSVADMKADSNLTAGRFVWTAGYFAPGDGGGAMYAVRAGTLTDDGGSVLTLQNGLQAILLAGDSVNYKQFGAVGDGVNDDGVQIKAAHAYANSRQLPVINETGEYWIKQTNEIAIQTNVHWGHTKLHIDESFNTKTNPRFRVTSRQEPIPITLDASKKLSVLAKLKPGTTLIPELAPYKNCLVFFADSQDKIGIRQGYANHPGWSKEEFFYVEEHGRIIGGIAWTFSDYTSSWAYPCDDHYLTIEGGTLLLSGDSPGLQTGDYWTNGITVSRSRTIIRNQWVGLEAGRNDVALSPRNGFYSFQRVFDITLENVRLMPWEKDREGTDRDVPQGTYGIGGTRVLNAVFRNVTAEGSSVHWGVFGTNLYKNFRIENCRLNRVDVHFHCWNLYIQDSEIGYKGLTLTGGGDLFIENTKRFGNAFISFRRDYGAKWDGHIRLRNCRLVVEDGAAETIALDFNPADFDYKYPVGYGRSIRIEDLTFDYTGVPNPTGNCRIMRIASFSKVTGTNIRLFFPQMIEFRNISVSGREKGVRILQIPHPYSLDLGKPGGMDGEKVTANCYMRFENIQCEKITGQISQAEANVNFLLKGLRTAAYQDEYSLYPKIDFVQVGEFFGHFQGSVADVSISRSLVNCVDAVNGGPMRGRIVFDNCDIRSDVADDGRDFYFLTTDLGVSFVNCTIHTPIVNGAPRPDLVDRYGFIQVNRALRGNHLNTQLSAPLVSYLANAGTPLSPEFVAMMKSHHAGESEEMAARKGTTAQRPAPSAFRSEKGFAYFDTDLGQPVVWNGTGWVASGKSGDTLHFYVDDLPSVAAGDSMKRAEMHPAQAYVVPRAGALSQFAAYASAAASGAAFTFELWKNGSLWIGGIAGPTVSSNPLLAAVPGGTTCQAGDRLSVRISGVSAGLPANAYATVDLYVSYTNEL
ncbi:hypothetical protein [Paenibacillus hemerocallicola]|uniref:hypothetical protein n=1 Tax=Paenibacillus hemerocallicola TaxID=1172614 RepID=UPI00159EDE33|nr:hypothetical protein [Paenibacillus hemerocallicola]